MFLVQYRWQKVKRMYTFHRADSVHGLFMPQDTKTPLVFTQMEDSIYQELGNGYTYIFMGLTQPGLCHLHYNHNNNKPQQNSYTICICNLYQWLSYIDPYFLFEKYFGHMLPGFNVSCSLC